MTPFLPLALVTSLSIVVIGWTLTKSRRQLRNPDEIINSMHPGEMRELYDFVTTNPDLLETDRIFWTRSKGTKGLRRKRHNAVCFVQLCQHLHLNSAMPGEDLGYMTQRAFLVSFLTGGSVLEGIPRIFMRSLPHLCARAATQLYWEMELRAQVLNLTFGTGHWIT